jgi:hypothetical protein
MFGIFCFVTLFLTTIVSAFFDFNKSLNSTVNYVKIIFIIIFLLFSLFNFFIGIYWIFDLNDDWSIFIQSGFDRFLSNNPSKKHIPHIHYLIYVVPYIFLICGFLCTLDFFKKFKELR